MSALEVSGLAVRLPSGGDRPHAVQDVAFSVERGEILCLVGESGSGKSVIAQAIMGLLPNTLPLAAGSIRLEGEELTRARGRFFLAPEMTATFAAHEREQEQEEGR